MTKCEECCLFSNGEKKCEECTVQPFGDYDLDPEECYIPPYQRIYDDPPDEIE